MQLLIRVLTPTKVEVVALMGNYILHDTMDVITYPRPFLNEFLLVNWGVGS